MYKSDKIKQLVAKYPTPFYFYDEAGIINTTKELNNAFSWNDGFKNYFAVKATPTPAILDIVRAQGMGFDCSSLVELALMEKIGVSGEDIMFSSNDTTAEEFKKAYELGAIINLDDNTHLDFLADSIGTLPELLCFRYNPGDIVKGNEIIGHPTEAKFGMTKAQILEGFKIAKTRGVKRFGLHTMVVSNNLDLNVHVKITQLIFELAAEIKKSLNIELEFINLGGGIGIPYKPTDKPFPLMQFSDQVKQAQLQILDYKPKIFMENGRCITGPHGYLVSKVLHIKKTYKTFVGLDASMQNLMRPGMYGAYHKIYVLDKEDQPNSLIYDVTGSLCENNDKFAINRNLPEINIGDILVICDAGAHGHTMGFNYNGKLKSAEIILKSDGTDQLIRRAETLDDYFATLKI